MSRSYLAVEGLGAVVSTRTVGRVVLAAPDDLLLRRRPAATEPAAFLAAVRAHAARLEAGESYRFAEGKGVLDAFAEFAARDGLAFDPPLDTNVHYDQCSAVRKVFVSLADAERFADLDDVTGFHEARPAPPAAAEPFARWTRECFGVEPKRGMFVYQQYKLTFDLDEAEEPSD